LPSTNRNEQHHDLQNLDKSLTEAVESFQEKLKNA
jgi:hypothetical protein